MMPDDPIEEAARVAAALSGFTSCAFCGAEFRKDVDAAKITEHVLHCPKHPIAEMMDKVKGFKKVADAYDEEYTRVRLILDEEGIPKVSEDHRMYSLSERVRLLAHKTHMSMKATLAFERDLQELMAKVRFEGDPKEL
jgi:hypothetical protein